jgi:hypothetical protein
LITTAKSFGIAGKTMPWTTAAPAPPTAATASLSSQQEILANREPILFEDKSGFEPIL